MLSSASSSLLVSTALPALSAGGAPADGADAGAAAGFAELLNSLSASLKMPAEEQPTGDEPAPEAAIATKAAIETGKILPALLPEAAKEPAKEAARTGLVTETGAEDVHESEGDTEAADTAVIAVDPALAFLSLTKAEAPAQPAAKTAVAEPAPSAAVPAAAPVAARLASKQGVDSAPADARGGGTVQITTAAPAEARGIAAVQTTAAGPDTAASQGGSRDAADAQTQAPAKAIRVAEQGRAEMPALQQPVASAPIVTAPADSAAAATNAPLATATAPAAAPSPFDINAVLDRLVAAREALMPVETALAVKHAEFGEVSIRIEQGSDGRLSAELSGADPELQRAVTAALGAERGSTAGGENDSRSPGQSQARGATAGGDGAAGEHEASRHERELNQNRNPAPQQAQPGHTDPNPGVFA